MVTPVVEIAPQFHISRRALLRWAVGALSDAGFKAAALHSVATVLAASATTKARPAALAELRELGGKFTL